MITAQDVIDLLQLQPLAEEGGFFRRTYYASETLPPSALPARYTEAVALGSAIYFLVTPDNFSAMHRLNTDELYHFYLGDPLELLLLHPDGSGEQIVLGQDLLAGMRPQAIAPHGSWQGSRLLPNGNCGFALIGTTMTPAFDWHGFELGQLDPLVQHYPHFAEAITRRVRPTVKNR